MITEDKPTNIAFSSEKLNFHMDQTFYESAPGLQLLHCIRSVILDVDCCYMLYMIRATYRNLTNSDAQNVLNFKTFFHSASVTPPRIPSIRIFLKTHAEVHNSHCSILEDVNHSCNSKSRKHEAHHYYIYIYYYN